MLQTSRNSAALTICERHIIFTYQDHVFFRTKETLSIVIQTDNFSVAICVKQIEINVLRRIRLSALDPLKGYT